MLCYSNIVIQIIESALKPKIENNLTKKKNKVKKDIICKCVILRGKK